MSSQKNKAIMDTFSSGNEVQKTKASWELKTTEYFIQACLKQVYKGEHSGTTLTKKGWKAVIAEFNSLTGRNYDKTQLKNRWDSLKKEWSIWYKLFAKETGLGWDSVKNTVDAPDEWWERKQLENPQYGKFRNKGLPFAHQLTTLFKDVVATGQFAYAPSSRTLPCQQHENEDGYRPSLNDLGVGVEEGSGDSEDVSNEATEEMANINLKTSRGSSNQLRGEKKNKVNASGRKNKTKVRASSKIADAIGVIAESFRSHTDSVPGSSIGEVMAELLTLDDVANDIELHAKCCQLMMLKPAREMFVALRCVEEKRLNWLKHATNNPLSFMKM